MKTAKKQFLASVVSLVLCVAMLAGTTLAWFTDSVSSKNQTITAGNLDVALDYYNGTEWVAVDGNTALFNENALWEPGYAEVVYLNVKNVGDLALKYQLGVNIVEEIGGVNVNGKPFMLSDYIKIGMVEMNGANDTFGDDRAAAIAAVAAEAVSLGSKSQKFDVLGSNKNDYVAIVVYMPESVGNEANYLNDAVEDYAPKITLGVNLFATQLANETDDFGDDYDVNAPFLNISTPIVRPQTPVDVTLKSEGKTAVEVKLPEAVVDALPEDVTSISIAVSEPEVDSVANTITFPAIEVVDQNGDIVDLAELDANVNITVELPAQEVFPAGETVMIYHDGVYVASAIVAADGTISYDVAHLCEVTVVKPEEPKADETDPNTITIGSVSELIWFANDVNSGNDYAGKTVVLTSDIDLNNAAWTPIGNWDYTFCGTFDGNGKTISNLYYNSAIVNVDDGIGFFGVALDATIKNLTLKNVDVTGSSMVAAVVAVPYYGCTISNCHVTGDVNVIAKVTHAGGIASYVENGYTVVIDNCSVIADEIGVIGSEEINAVGGIIGWLNDGESSVTDCQVKNLNITGWANVGSISGFIDLGTTVADCSAENITLTKTREGGNPSIGAIAGGWCYSEKTDINVSNITLKDITIDSGVSNDYNVPTKVLFGSEYGGAVASNIDYENISVENVMYNDTPVAADFIVVDVEKIDATIEYFGDKYDLTAYEYKAPETLDESIADWYVDFRISADKAVKGGLILAGQYDNWSVDWVSIEAGEGEYTDYRLMVDGAKALGYTGTDKWTYEEVFNIVGAFRCGFVDTMGANAGTTITVELILTNPANGQEVVVHSVSETL